MTFKCNRRFSPHATPFDSISGFCVTQAFCNVQSRVFNKCLPSELRASAQENSSNCLNLLFVSS